MTAEPTAPEARHGTTPARGRGLLAVYAVVAAADVLAHVADSRWGGRAATAVAVPLLLAWLLTTSPRPLARPLRAMAAGLVLAWCGDMLLMWDGDLLFALGIAAFAGMQVAYVVAFRRVPGPGLVRAWPIAVVPYVLVWLVLAALMTREAGVLYVPAVLYGLLLVAMALSALDLVLRVPRRAGWRVAAGAALFVVSDGLIALTAFAGLTDGVAVSTAVMATYLSAQVMIVTGFAEAVDAGRPD